MFIGGLVLNINTPISLLFELPVKVYQNLCNGTYIVGIKCTAINVDVGEIEVQRSRIIQRSESLLGETIQLIKPYIKGEGFFYLEEGFYKQLEKPLELPDSLPDRLENMRLDDNIFEPN